MLPLPEPFADFPLPPDIAALPKADIHIHPEWSPRLDRVLAQRENRPSFDWRSWWGNIMQTEAPGQNSLWYISTRFPAAQADDTDENFVARMVDLFEEAASDNAVLCEVRLGKDMAYRPGCIELCREAERQVRASYPRFHAAMIPFIHLDWQAETVERVFQSCIEWAKTGLLYGVDLFNAPYDSEADWTAAYRAGERLAAAGLGITVHVAEVAPVNIAAVLKMPGLTRLGHATHAGYHPHLLELVARSGVTIECPLTCNVVLGAAQSYEAHPIRRFVAAGIPVALCTDNPVQMHSPIGREYALAIALGFSHDDLLTFTRNAIGVAFIAPSLRQALLAEVNAYPLK